MTSTTLDPLAFDPYSVPPSGSTASRMPAGRTPGGHVDAPDDAEAAILWNLLLDRQREAPQLVPERRDIALKKVVRAEDGTYKLVDRPPLLAGPPTREPVRPGKFASLTCEGADLLVSAFLGEESFTLARDADLWKAALAAAELKQYQGRALRRLSDATACLIALRAGVVVGEYDLPD